MSDLRMLGRLALYEQRTFWRRPPSVVFTFLFPIALLFFLGTTVGRAGGGGGSYQVLVPAMAAFAVQGACFNDLAIGVVTRRESGLLKRLRLTPVPAWFVLLGTLVSAAIVGLLLSGITLITGWLLFGLKISPRVVFMVPVLLAGIACFTALGLAVASLLKGAEAAAPVITVSYLAMNFLSGTFVPIDSGSTLGQVARVLPSHHFVRGAISAVALDGGAILWRSVLVMSLWAAAAGLVAVRRFRWTPKTA